MTENTEPTGRIPVLIVHTRHLLIIQSIRPYQRETSGYPHTTNNNISDSYVLRIFVTNSNIDPIRKLELEQFGINTILIIDNYSEFYLKIFDLFDSIKIESDDLLNDFKNLKVEKLGKGAMDNKRFLQGFNIFNNNGTYYLPDFVVKREITKQVLEDIYSNTLTLVIGRRVSGKTILMLQILQSIKDKNVYFFPSDVSLSSVDIKNALSRKNSVILFDSNSISYQDAHNILNNIDSIKKNNSSIIFAINSSDRLMFALLSSPEHIGYYEIPDKLGKSDTDSINKELSKLGLTNLISNQTIIENFFRYSDIYSHNILNLPTINIDNVTNYDLKIFIILASMDKIYSILFHILGIQYIYAEECLRKYEPALQKEYPNFIELHQHSGFKAISNCRSWIYLMLSSFTKDDKSVNRIALNIYEIVESIHENPKYWNIYKNIILFDTLNQIFYKKEGGVIKLIFLIYEKLENLLYEEGHYWLQRAKSILYLRRNDEKSLQKALDYAKKSHYDSSYDLKLKNNSTLTIAQILGRLSKIHKYKHDYLVSESIKWYYDALQKNRFNKKYVDNVIAKARKDKNRNDLYSLISHLLKRKIQEPALRRHAEWLVNLIIIKS